MNITLEKVQKAYQMWVQFWEVPKDENTEGILKLIFRVGLLLLGFLVFSKVIGFLSSTSRVDFTKPILISQVVLDLFTIKKLLVLIPTVAFFFLFRKELLTRWSYFQNYKPLRVFILIITCLLAWNYTTYNYNLYYNQWYYVDRLLILFLIPLIYWRPIFVVLFVFQMKPMLTQFVAMNGYFMLIPSLLIKALKLFSAFLILSAVTKTKSISTFLFLFCCLVASHYWAPGTAKLNSDWLVHNELKYFFFGAYANGWLTSLDISSIQQIGEMMDNFNIPMKILTLVAEVGAISFFLHRTWSKIIIASWITMQMGIFFTGGVFFWMWIFMAIGLLSLFIIKNNGFSEVPIFSRSHLAMSIILILASSYWAKPYALGWQDVPMSAAFKYEAEMEDGHKEILHPDFFSPYHDASHFCAATFFQGIDFKKAPIYMGNTQDIDFARFLRQAKSEKEIVAYEKENGKNQYNEKYAEEFKAFITRYITNWNTSLEKDAWFSVLKAPDEIISFGETNKALGKIKRLKVIHVSFFTQKNRPKVIREKTFLEIDFTN